MVASDVPEKIGRMTTGGNMAQILNDVTNRYYVLTSHS